MPGCPGYPSCSEANLPTKEKRLLRSYLDVKVSILAVKTKSHPEVNAFSAYQGLCGLVYVAGADQILPGKMSHVGTSFNLWTDYTV